MRVLVYVEGPSDSIGLSALLAYVVASAASNKVGIKFIPLGNKSAVLEDSPRKAADHLLDNPDDWVFALPDLYPMAGYDGTRNAHSSFTDLRALLSTRFTARSNAIGLPVARRNAFRIHCLKHDLEALILGSPDQLRLRLRTKHALVGRWRRPVETQNDHQPPKRVVEELFSQYRKKPGYQDTVDAPWILGRADLGDVRRNCPQHFAPFVNELETLADLRPLA